MHNTLSTIHAQHPIPGTAPLTSDRRDFLIRAGFGAAVWGGLSAAGGSAMAAGPQPAPGKLSGADNFYQSDKVAVRKVTFKNQYRMAVAGNLFVPKNLDRSKKNPAILVGHPMGAVKEQSANLYATKMAEQGFVALSLDLPFWGESDGQPRNAVAPDIYAEAFSAAVDFLGTQAMVDRERIGAIGVCGSGSFVISAAKIGKLTNTTSKARFSSGAVVSVRASMNHPSMQAPHTWAVKNSQLLTSNGRLISLGR